MGLFIASLNSGSNGNCYYVGNLQEAILIDAGLSGRETNLRMERQITGDSPLCIFFQQAEGRVRYKLFKFLPHIFPDKVFPTIT